jgi:hypothetical protein
VDELWLVVWEGDWLDGVWLVGRVFLFASSTTTPFFVHVSCAGVRTHVKSSDSMLLVWLLVRVLVRVGVVHTASKSYHRLR